MLNPKQPIVNLTFLGGHSLPHSNQIPNGLCNMYIRSSPMSSNFSRCNLIPGLDLQQMKGRASSSATL